MGGKGQAGTYQTIINQIPPHSTYIELFAGGGAVLRCKRPAQYSIAVDADAAAVAALAGLGIPGLTAKVGDALDFLRKYPWIGGEFVYLDPPYLGETRKSQRRYYAHEFETEELHLELLSLLLAVPAGVYLCISGYRSPLYDAMLPGWRRVDYQVVTRGGGLATESLWMNYPEPTELHDYSFLGDNYREREKIARRKKRWRRRLESMPALERYALLSSIDEMGEGGQLRSTTGESGEAAEKEVTV